MLEELLVKKGPLGVAPAIVEYVALSLGIIIATVIGRLKLFQGKRDAATQNDKGTSYSEIAGAVIDKEKADEIVDVVGRLIIENHNGRTQARALMRALTQLTGAVAANTDAAKRTCTQIEEARKDIRRLADEMIRAGGPR